MSTQTVDTPVTATMFTRKMGEAMRQQSVCIEIPVTIQGSRLASGDANNSNATKTFIEESRTMIVFPMGAVVRFSEPVSEGQVLILKNLRMNREVACRVVCSKTSANVKGFVEVEFVQPADGFWGISFPAIPRSSQTSADAQGSKSSAQNGTFQVPQMPARKPHVISNVTPQEFAPPQTSKPDASSIPAPVSSANLNNAIPAAYTAPVESTHRLEPAPTTAAPRHSDSNGDVHTHYDQRTTPPPTIPLVTADSNQAVKGNGAVDLAGLIVDDSQEGEARGTIEREKPPASAHASPTETSSITSVVMPDNGTSISTMSRKFGAPAVQHDIQLSKDVSFGVHLSPEPSKRTGIFTVVAALIVVSLAGAGAYWWYFLRGAATHAPTASVAATTDSNQPSANPPATPPAEIVPQNNPAAAAKTQSAPSTQNALVKKTNANPGNSSTAAPNTRAAAPPTTASEDAPTPARKPNIISSKMAAPKMPSGNAGNSANLTAPDLSTPNSRPISNTPLLGGLNSLPVPPPAPVVVTPAPIAASTAPVASDIIKQPKLLSSVTAIYPKMAQLRGDFGVVSVDALVNETGRVTSAKAISGPSSLRQSAVDAVMQQRYSPATINGRPAATHVTVNVEYKRKQ